ncbi:MAG: glycosyltransferase [Candidatus Bathyarchaeia archaeon]
MTERVSWAAVVGQIASYTALAFGILFFAFACKYYAAILLTLLGGERINENRINVGPRGAQGLPNQDGPDKSGVDGASKSGDDDEPFVSIHLPFYNERNVARRIIQACMDLNYTNYEVVVVDDSRDETIEILRELSRRKGPPTIKCVHRKDRRGFKGGALAEAVNHMDPRTEYVAVFDADFIPPPDIIRRFLWYFDQKNWNSGGTQGGRGGHRFADRVIGHFNNKRNSGRGGSTVERVEDWYIRRKVAAVQGYQLHYLNKSENWVTRGVRAEFSGSYMVERVAEEFFGAMKMISGSVFMLRADVLKKLGWTTSITEDWDLTIRLYLEGHKVVYTPLIQAAGEIPTTLQRLVRQRMRWAEGHTFAVKKYFWDVLRSRNLTFREKLEFLYFAPYYLQSLLFLVGTVCWMVAELLRQHPWFWTAIFGWCLVLSNLFALPLMGLAGLFLERTALEDLTGILSLVVLTFALTPFQAYAALKGLLERDEGGWVRTLKTGSITDRLLRVRIRKRFSWIMPRRGKGASERRGGRGKSSAVVLLCLVTVSSLISWLTVSAMSMPDHERGDTTALTFERRDPAVTVNGIETNRILTHPDYTRLGGPAFTDTYTTSKRGWSLAWRFYLHGPLVEDYTLRGKLVFYLYLDASRECEVDIWFKLREVDERGVVTDAADIIFRDVDLDADHAEEKKLESRAIKKKKFEEGHTLLVEVRLKSESNKETTYRFHYGSIDRRSRIEFPGIVVPEEVLPLVLVAPLIPLAVLRAKRRMDKRLQGSGLLHLAPECEHRDG